MWHLDVICKSYKGSIFSGGEVLKLTLLRT